MSSYQPQLQMLSSITKVRYGPDVLQRPLPIQIIALHIMIQEDKKTQKIWIIKETSYNWES